MLLLTLCRYIFCQTKIINSIYYYFNCVGRDAAFIGANENQFAILDEDKTGLALYILPGTTSQEVEKNGVVEQNPSMDADVGSIRGPMQFMFETTVDRIFSTPLGTKKKKTEKRYLNINVTVKLMS